jgi:hypothetical protein
VCREVAERSGAGRSRVEAPDLRVRIAPVLEIPAAEVADLAEFAGVDELACEPDGRDEAVVERAEMLDAGRGDPLPDLEALVRGAPEGLLADDVLARLGGEDRRLGVERVRAEAAAATSCNRSS